MKLEVIKITPTIAAKILKSNTINRPIRERAVNYYAEQMKNGQWKLNTGETIQISKNNVLLNGQHRLLALIKAGVTISFAVASELEETVFDVLDTGRMRSASDVFNIANAKYAALIPAILQRFSRLKSSLTAMSTGRLSVTKTPAQLLEVYNTDKGKYEEIASKAALWYANLTGNLIHPSLIGALYLLFCEKSVEDADFFFEDITSLAPKCKSLVLLKDVLLRNKFEKRKISESQQLALIFKAWNYMRCGADVKVLRYVNGETFPVLE